jgi:hypothetical protein
MCLPRRGAGLVGRIDDVSVRLLHGGVWRRCNKDTICFRIRVGRRRDDHMLGFGNIRCINIEDDRFPHSSREGNLVRIAIFRRCGAIACKIRQGRLPTPWPRADQWAVRGFDNRWFQQHRPHQIRALIFLKTLFALNDQILFVHRRINHHDNPVYVWRQQRRIRSRHHCRTIKDNDIGDAAEQMGQFVPAARTQHRRLRIERRRCREERHILDRRRKKTRPQFLTIPRAQLRPRATGIRLGIEQAGQVRLSRLCIHQQHPVPGAGEQIGKVDADCAACLVWLRSGDQQRTNPFLARRQHQIGLHMAHGFDPALRPRFRSNPHWRSLRNASQHRHSNPVTNITGSVQARIDPVQHIRRRHCNHKSAKTGKEERQIAP